MAATPTNKVPTWKELAEEERRYREKLIKIRAKKRRMPTHAECVEALVELGAEERERKLGRKVLSTAKIDGGAYRWIKLPDGSSRVEEWHFGKGWKPGGADIDEFWFTPPVSPALAARMGIPPDDLA